MAWNLTNPALQYDQPPQVDPASGMQFNAPAILKFFKNPALRAQQFAHDAAQQAQPGTSTVNGSIGEPSVSPGAEMLPGPVSASVPSSEYSPGQDQTTVGQSAPPTPTFPKFIQPKFADTLSQPNGMPAPVNPAQTKLGKLLAVIKLAAEGAGDGAQAGSFGGGFAAAQQGQYQQAAQQQALQRGQIENQLQQSQIAMLPWQRAQQIAALQKSQADIGRTQAETAAIPTKTELEKAQAEAAQYKDDPNLGLIDLRTKQPVSDAGFAPITADEAQILGKQPGERVPLKVKNTASEIVNRGKTTVNTEEGVYDYNRNTGTKTKLGNNPRMVFAPENKFVAAAADPNNPGNLTYMRVGEAAKVGAAAPQSASVQIPRAELKAELPTKIGDQKVAFNTAIAHADLLRQVAKALKNKDSRTLSGLKNRFQSEFGSTNLNDFNVVAGAYAREVTKMLSGGHLTDAEISQQGATLPSNANLETLLSAVDKYKSLSQSKLKMLNQQVDNTIQKSQGKTPTAPPEIHYTIVNGQLVAQ